MPSRPHRYDIGIVLGAGLDPAGRPSAALRRRVAHAAALYGAGRLGMLLMTGGRPRRGITEAEVMRRLAEETGVPAAVIVTEDRSRDTLENALRCRAVIARRGWRSVLVISDAYHLPRAMFTFHRLGVVADGDAVPGARPTAALLLREAAARVVYRWRVWWAGRRN
jgi:uncharacterized SAM-binding protein YcdF (DUF218 family)